MARLAWTAACSRFGSEAHVMLGELDEKQIDQVLHAESIGRLGCVANGWPYVVPVTYVYDGENLYAHSGEGMKLRAMRDNPLVCLEVEQIRSMANWRTVLVRGRFEELSDDDEERALALLTARLSLIETSATAKLVQHEDIVERERLHRSVPFRIRVEDRTGRFELI